MFKAKRKLTFFFFMSALFLMIMGPRGALLAQAPPPAGSGHPPWAKGRGATPPGAPGTTPTGSASAAAPPAHKPAKPEAAKGEHSASRPAFVVPPAKPTEVKIGVYLVGLTNVSAPQEGFPSFKGEFYMELEWVDPRLKFDAKEKGTKREVFQGKDAARELERIWWPDPEIENEQGKRKTESSELVIKHDGHVEYIERFNATMHAQLNLRRFPFDTQTFKVTIQSLEWDQSSVRFVPNPQRSGFNAKHKVLEWIVKSVHSNVRSEKEVRSKTAFSEYDFSIVAERDPGYYNWKILGPLVLIIVLTWVTFFMRGETSEPRMERVFMALLTVVAFHQLISQNLPRISYITFLDAVVFVAFGFVGVNMLEVAITQNFAHDGEVERAEAWDRQARWIMPLGFLMALSVLWYYFHHA